MKKFLTAIILSFVFAFTAVGFAGCGDKGDKGEKGATGADGKSAYQIWLDSGHTGTEEDFLAFITGANGITPLFRVGGDYCWEVSYDNGETYINLGVTARADITEDKYFTFTADNEDNTCSIKAKDVANMPENLVLPAYYNGKPVTIISINAFKDCASIKSVIIPTTVIYIYYSAFQNCTSLESIEISGSVEYIMSYIFEGCTSLKSIVINEGVEELDNFALKGCSALESVIIPVSITRIGSSAFQNDTSLDTITYSGTVDEWNAIAKDDLWTHDSNILHIHCLADDQTIDL